MDMRRYLKRFLNEESLKRMNGRYDGVIAQVVEEPIRNKFIASKQLEPIIKFEDGWLLIPNNSNRKALIEMFGPETSAWIGQRIVVFRHPVTRTTKSGCTTTRYEKRVAKFDSAIFFRKEELAE